MTPSDCWQRALGSVPAVKAYAKEISTHPRLVFFDLAVRYKKRQLKIMWMTLWCCDEIGKSWVSAIFFEASPEVESLDLDLSGITLGENDGSPIVEPKVYEKTNIDLSEYSVSENDGTPLMEAAPEVEKVQAPDFGLDAPGATLETLKEEVELLNPDTSGMSLAFPGTEILNPEEKDQGPPPKAPDTSSISLEPNRATF